MTEKLSFEKPAKFIELAEGFYVSPQITLDDIEAAKDMGIKLIISNRPDGEEPHQPLNQDLESAATIAGIKFSRIPVDARGIARHHMDDFKQVMEGQDGPILAFCRSGTRSTMLRAFVQANTGQPVSDIVREASVAGYDLYTIVPRLEAVVPEKRRARRTPPAQKS